VKRLEWEESCYKFALGEKPPRAAFWAFVVKEVEDQARPNKKSTCGVEAVFAE